MSPCHKKVTVSALPSKEECNAVTKPTIPALDEVGKEGGVGGNALTVLPPRDSAHRQLGLSPFPALDEVGQERGVG